METKYLAERHSLSGGWEGFSLQHNLIVGDVLVSFSSLSHLPKAFSDSRAPTDAHGCETQREAGNQKVLWDCHRSKIRCSSQWSQLNLGREEIEGVTKKAKLIVITNNAMVITMDIINIEIEHVLLDTKSNTNVLYYT
nr:B3 domain-containing protein Os03g0184500-like [Ipomoea trifida]